MALVYCPRIVSGYGVNYVALNATLSDMVNKLENSIFNISIEPIGTDFLGSVWNRLLVATCKMVAEGPALVLYCPKPLFGPATSSIPIEVSSLNVKFEREVSGWCTLEKNSDEPEVYNNTLKYVYYVNWHCPDNEIAYLWWSCILPMKE
jgi:hypothetical protein